MKIIDLYGETLEVTDLAQALAQANEFRRYRYTNNSRGEFEEERHIYWEDIYTKLKEFEDPENLNKNNKG